MLAYGLMTCLQQLSGYRQGVRFAPGGIRKGAAGFDITFCTRKAK